MLRHIRQRSLKAKHYSLADPIILHATPSFDLCNAIDQRSVHLAHSLFMILGLTSLNATAIKINACTDDRKGLPRITDNAFQA